MGVLTCAATVNALCNFWHMPTLHHASSDIPRHASSYATSLSTIFSYVRKNSIKSKDTKQSRENLFRWDNLCQNGKKRKKERKQHSDMQLSNAQQPFPPCPPLHPLGIFGNCFIYSRLFIANCVKGLFTLLSAMETIYSLSKQLLQQFIPKSRRNPQRI